MNVVVNWTELGEGSPQWNYDRCLYLYAHPIEYDVLYIGMAFSSAISGRLHGVHKENVFGAICEEYEIDEIVVFSGELQIPEQRRLTRHLLNDVETLLINAIQPFGNISARVDRIARPGMTVQCIGDWPHAADYFEDSLR